MKLPGFFRITTALLKEGFALIGVNVTKETDDVFVKPSSFRPSLDRGTDSFQEAVMCAKTGFGSIVYSDGTDEISVFYNINNDKGWMPMESVNDWYVSVTSTRADMTSLVTALIPTLTEH